MINILRYLFFFVFVINSVTAQSFNYDLPNVPQMRQIFHDNINKSQIKILSLNCKRDSIFLASNNLDFNLFTTYQLKNKIDYLQYFVEADSTLSESDKYKWLRGINDLLQDFYKSYTDKNIGSYYLANLIIAYQEAMLVEISNQSIIPIINKNELEVGTLLLSNFALQSNTGVAESKLILIYKLCVKHPENTLKILSNYSYINGAEKLLIDFAYHNPQELYDYAASNNELGLKIKSIDDPLVSVITQMANTNDGRFLFPFLDEIIDNEISIAEIKKTIDDSEAYYKLLVKTQIYYEQKKQRGKKILSIDALTEKLKFKAYENYISKINALHDEPNATIRFASIQNLTPTELYYLIIMGEEEMYTSSFINGVYPKIIDGLAKLKSDTLLKMVHYGYYRKFLKMCASFNMLEDYLSKMDKPVAENLMKSFANDLEQNKSLEEVVDVADSYASIKDTSIKKIIINVVRDNIKKHLLNNNKRGVIIYGLLNQIFSSFDTLRNFNIGKIFDIPSVYHLTNNSLKADNGRIYVQQFFYGDKDGKDFYNDFVNSFRSLGWKIINKLEWIEVSSSGNSPVTIFTNKPLNEDEGLDEIAQKKLYYYLDSLHIYPTIAIHRGHSYYVKSTISQISSYVKLVLLGSCGGYHSLSKVLNISPQAHIIASKQIGTGKINISLIELIMENLKQGKDLYWQSIWKSIEHKFLNNKEVKEKFDDYIPPHKNLGAIFIMAYYKAME